MPASRRTTIAVVGHTECREIKAEVGMSCDKPRIFSRNETRVDALGDNNLHPTFTTKSKKHHTIALSEDVMSSTNDCSLFSNIDVRATV